jgi:cytochrome c-type biogenesis protein CcmF
LLYRRDFRIDYVFSYTGLELPDRYQLAAFWAGQKGSFLLWLLFGAWIGVLLERRAGPQGPTVMGIYTLVQLGLLLILVRESPFLMLDRTPEDGRGLNPLLQNGWMGIHPPVMFVGYALAAVPFAFAVAGLLEQNPGDWARRAQPWVLAGFLVLGTAILLGGYWAYVTLGWGGYWGWDPVENASLVPWLFGGALLHGLYFERTRGRFRRLNLILTALLFLSVLYGTFLTRSGVLADFSVHSFVDLGISGWLVGLMAFFLLLAAAALGLRLGQVTTKPNEDPPVSRGSFLVMGVLVFVASALVVLLGTSAPLLTRAWESPAQVGPEFYNQVHRPIALALALLLIPLPWLRWSTSPSPRELALRLLPAGVAGCVAAVAGWLVGIRDVLDLALLSLPAAAAFSNLSKVLELVRARGWRKAGGYLAHVGVGLSLVGFLVSSAYDHSVKLELLQGQPVAVGPWTLTFERFLPREGLQRERAQVRVTHADGRSYLAYPYLFVNERTQQLMVHPHVESFWWADHYLSPIQFDPGRRPGQPERLRLARREALRVGEAEVRFVDFDLGEGRAALASMVRGGPVEIKARLEWLAETQPLELFPVYRFYPDGRVESPPLALPNGANLALTGVDATNGRIELTLEPAPGDPGSPPRLALDWNIKPLMSLVWGGFYLVLGGTLLALLEKRPKVYRE